MKKMKNVVCGVLAITVCLAFAPMQSIALSNKGAVSYPDQAAGKYSNGEKAYFLNDRGLLSPNCNCDPHMLLPGNTAIDPKFLLEPGKKGK